MKQKIYFFICLALFLSGCNKEGDDHLLPCDTRNYTFFYHGNIYQSTYEMRDSLMVFNNDEVNKIWQLLKKNPHLALFQREDGNVEYFDNRSELEHKLPEYLKIATRGFPWDIHYLVNEVSLTYWKGYHDKQSWSHVLNKNDCRSISVDSYIGTGMNDAISSCDLIASFSVYNDSPGLRNDLVLLTFYEDISFRGRSVTMYVDHIKTKHIENDLSYLRMPDGRSWNDIISSMKCEILISPFR